MPGLRVGYSGSPLHDEPALPTAHYPIREVIMAIQFYGKDPDCPGNNCPAVFRDEETGDFYFQGETVVDPEVLARLSKDSGLADSESVVKLPASMVEMIVEAVRAGALVR
jgi:protein-disulfide isomerase-like protein with CxxC motif